MDKQKYILWKEEYHYSAAYGFEPNIYSYIHEDDEVRPGIIIVPGGGYRFVSPSEGEMVAEKFYEMGYQAFVCTYTTNMMSLEVLKDQPMKDLSRAIRFIRANCEKFRLDPEKLFLCGFSAGGHLCGSLAVHWNDIKDEDAAYQAVSNKPTGVILSYPVITSGTFGHKDSFVSLYGEDATEEELNYASLEKQVTDQTSPIFIWQTVTDELVSVENSYLMAEALEKAGVTYEHHVFSRGQHGLSLANERWAANDVGDDYTMEQTYAMIKALKEDRIQLPEETKQMMLGIAEFLDLSKDNLQIPGTSANVPVKAVAIWPELADAWMKDLCDPS